MQVKTARLRAIWGLESCLLSMILAASAEMYAAKRIQRIILDRHVFSSKYASPSVDSLSQIKQPRGIVFPSGGARQLANTYVAAQVIRNHVGCQLPMEVAFFGQHEMDTYHRTLFEVSHSEAAKGVCTLL